MPEQERRVPADAPVEYVCLSKHGGERGKSEKPMVTTHAGLPAYCARGADGGHHWVRVPPTPAELITIDKMEDRPPQPRGRDVL